MTVAFPAGRFTAVLGPSGSGKYTLLHLLGRARHAEFRQVLAGGENREQVERLEHEPDPIAAQPRQLALRQRVQPDIAEIDRAGTCRCGSPAALPIARGPTE
jgi:ABC-type cobalamin/Fe3+-siderophores transport system ATPase subunit